MAEYTFWKFKWAYNAADPAVTFIKGPEGTGYYSGYSASGAFRGSYLRAAEPATAAPVVAQPAAPEPVNQKFAGWGRVIPISMGQRRMSPQIIWLRQPISIGVTATADFAVSWGYNADDNPDDTVVSALYADATLIWTIEGGPLLPGDWSWTYYPGTETQMPDPTMVAANGAENTPAYRNQLVGVFLNFPLANFGFKLPGISAEITGSGGEAPRFDTWNPDDRDPTALLSSQFTLTKGVWPDDPGVGTQSSGVRSRTFHRKGQYYLEYRLDYYDTVWRPGMIFEDWTATGVGFSLATHALDSAPGRGFYGVGTAMPMVGPIDRYHIACAPVGTDMPDGDWGSGDTIGVHIDMNEGLVRARVVSRGGPWSAQIAYVDRASPPFNPAPTIELGDPLFVHGFVSVPVRVGVSLADQITANFGGLPFMGAIPAGATAWNGSGGTGELLGVLPLRDFISKISTYCGLVPETDLDFEGIDDVIHGGLITRDTTFSDFLTVLGRAYGFDFYEGEQIRIVRRVIGTTYVIDKVIPREDLIVEGDRSIQTTRRKDDSPTEIELSYIDRTQQFRWNIQKARRILFPVKTTRSVRKDAFAIPVITTANEALTLAGRAMYREAMQNVDHDASMLPRHIAVEPSDILTITAGDTEYTVKVMSVAMNADSRLQFTAVNLLTDEDMSWTADAGSPNLPYAGNLYHMDATEGADSFTGSQFIGNMFATEGEDIFVGVLITVSPGALAATDGTDLFEGAGPLTLPDPSFASVVLLSGFNGADAATSATDEATAKTITFVGNAQLDTAQLKFGSASLLLDGTGDYLTLADSPDWDFGSGQFTVECWVRFNSIPADTALLSQWDTSGGNCAWWLNYNSSSGLGFNFMDSSITFRSVAGAWTASTATWYHVAVDRDASGVIRLYVDGVMKGSGSNPQVFRGSFNPLSIGRLQHTSTMYLDGWLDEVRITKGVARYASDSGYTVPTAAFPRS